MLPPELFAQGTVTPQNPHSKCRVLRSCCSLGECQFSGSDAAI